MMIGHQLMSVSSIIIPLYHIVYFFGILVEIILIFCNLKGLDNLSVLQQRCKNTKLVVHNSEKITHSSKTLCSFVQVL